LLLAEVAVAEQTVVIMALALVVQAVSVPLQDYL
jgi:hypothetical protein